MTAAIDAMRRPPFNRLAIRQRIRTSALDSCFCRLRRCGQLLCKTAFPLASFAVCAWLIATIMAAFSEAPWPRVSIQLSSDTTPSAVLMMLTAENAVSKELKCLAQNIYFEARGEPVQGKLAVAHVVMNRVASPRFPSTICGVVQQGGYVVRHRCQFSWWCDGKSETITDRGAWLDSLDLALRIYSNRSQDPTGNALWYHAEYVSPAWRSDFAEGPKIGRHIFYSLKSSVAPPIEIASNQSVN